MCSEHSFKGKPLLPSLLTAFFFPRVRFTMRLIFGLRFPVACTLQKLLNV